MVFSPLNQLLQTVKWQERSGDENPIIHALAYDSRNVSGGCLFFAVPGEHTDGHNYIKDAAKKGALAIIHSSPLSFNLSIPTIRVVNVRAALSNVSSAFYGHPSREMTVVGVTGTDGKSTTVSMIRQLLNHAERPAGSISTVEFAMGTEIQPNRLRQSTPESLQIQEFLHTLKKREINFAVIEATSHGLSEKTSRLSHVDFDAAVFTNLTGEHLDFHGSLENYRNDKKRLFQMVAASRNPQAFGVVNHDDMNAPVFRKAAKNKAVYSYSLHDSRADYFTSSLVADAGGTRFTLHTKQGTHQTNLPFPGIYNVENALAALCAAVNLSGESPLEMARHLPRLQCVKGRMEPVKSAADFDVIVDYAHSPGSFSKILPFLKGLCKGRLILVFGSAGERDVVKRPQQGNIASAHANAVFLTNEDPRNENPLSILEDIAKGTAGLIRGENLFLIPNRREALKKAFQYARPGDLVAALGKGHEKSILHAKGSESWDEAEVCRELLEELGF